MSCCQPSGTTHQSSQSSRRGADSNPSESARAHLSARDVHDRLIIALTELRRAEQNAVLWFAEVLRRKLYRQLGYASIQQYAAEALGSSSGKTSQFIRLSESLRSLPELNRAVATGEVSWTKAREVAAVATRSTEGKWIEVARTSSRRDLERRIARSKSTARVARRRDPAQRSLSHALCDAPSDARGDALIDAPSDALGAGPAASGANTTSPEDALTIQTTVRLRFSPEQLARFDALVEAAREQGYRSSREELVLGGLKVLAAGHAAEADDGVGAHQAAVITPARSTTPARPTTPKVPAPPRIHRSPYQVVVYQCESCGQGHVPTSRGDRAIDLATLRAIACDTEMVGRGKRLRATVYPGKRREVLARDGHRCQAAGCRNTRFLQVHHQVPLAFGGTDDVTNLVTLCRECHRWVHEQRERLQTVGCENPPGI